ncbi:hypothetical protein ACKKBG_A16640 [Auxenochlorella protothecoides x Auxenochlorella symbiontica]
MNAPQKCQFFLTQKNRTCKFDVVPGKNYCGNHLPQAEGSRPRIRCPWDPAGAHEIYADEVEKHRLKCPAYLQIQAQRAAPYYQLDINAGAALDVEPIPGACLPGHSMAERRAAYAATLGPDGLDDLIERVCQAAERLPPLPPVDALNQAAAAPPAPAPGVTTPPYSAKHAAQQASIVGHLERHGLLRCVADDVIVELGAGRGYLGAAVAGHCASLTCLVLVDCRGFKLKADRALRHLDLHRLRCDLKDFSLAGCPGLDRPGPSGGAPPRSWVGVAKHLCGAASDFALRAAVEQAPRRCRGLGLATCCHHRCSWRAYVGKEWFAERGFAPAEFELGGHCAATRRLQGPAARRATRTARLAPLQERSLAPAIKQVQLRRRSQAFLHPEQNGRRRGRGGPPQNRVQRTGSHTTTSRGQPASPWANTARP